MVSLESRQDLPATVPPISAARHVTRPVTGRRSCGRTNEPLPIVSASGCNSHFRMTRSCLDAVLLAGGMHLKGGRDPLGPPSKSLQAAHHPCLVILGYDVMRQLVRKCVWDGSRERQDHYKCVLVLLFADPFRLPFRLNVEEGWPKTQGRHRITLASHPPPDGGMGLRGFLRVLIGAGQKRNSAANNVRGQRPPRTPKASNAKAGV